MGLNMQLSEWRTRKNWTQEQLGKALCCDTSTIYRYESGVRLPQREAMADIYALTRGAVSPNDFYILPALIVERQAA